jgi:hypothetical protein
MILLLLCSGEGVGFDIWYGSLPELSVRSAITPVQYILLSRNSVVALLFLSKVLHIRISL